MVLDDLYCGNIYPAEQVVPHEKEYRKLHRHTGELLTGLEEKLSKEQMELVNQFHTHVIDVHCMELRRLKISYIDPLSSGLFCLIDIHRTGIRSNALFCATSKV